MDSISVIYSTQADRPETALGSAEGENIAVMTMGLIFNISRNFAKTKY